MINQPMGEKLAEKIYRQYFLSCLC